MTAATLDTALSPSQRRTFDGLLVVGGERPVMAVGLIEELEAIIASGTKQATAKWTEPRLWMSKSTIGTVLRCEGQLVSDRATPPSTTMHSATAVGIVTHRAIAISHTHPGRNVAEYVEAARRASMSELAFSNYWEDTDIATQSDLIGQMVSKTTLFLDSFPPLSASWTPRFEESIQARIGKLVLSAKPDLILGRPRADGRQTMFLGDMKTGAINDEHEDEAMFYALVAALRFGIAPWRSVVYSLASGDWTEPEVTKPRLLAAAERVVMAVRSMTDVLTDSRPPLLNAGRWCNWCSASETCPAAIAERAAS